MDLPAISDGDRFAILLRPGYLPVPRRPVFRLRISSTDNYIPNSSLQKTLLQCLFDVYTQRISTSYVEENSTESYSNQVQT